MKQLMADKTFTFVKLDTGGRLIIKARSERAAREKMKLDPDAWKLEEDKSTISSPEGEESED